MEDLERGQVVGLVDCKGRNRRHDKDNDTEKTAENNAYTERSRGSQATRYGFRCSALFGV